MVMIQVSNLTFNYKKSRNKLFNELNLTLEPGNIYGLLGRNGAGKTTFLKLLCGLLYSNQGSATLFGINANQRNPELLADLFFIPEDLVAPSMKASEFIKVYSPFYPKFNHALMEDLMNEYELDRYQNLKKMSFGQRKKFIIAFGLATSVRLLILDEPTNGLDIPSKSQFRKMVSSNMTDDKIIIISTHQVRDLQSMIDPVVVLEKGKIVFNQDNESIQQKLSFGNTKDQKKPENAIYEEENAFGSSFIYAKVEEDKSAIDIELLFNAIVADSHSISKIFNS